MLSSDDSWGFQYAAKGRTNCLYNVAETNLRVIPDFGYSKVEQKLTT